MDQFLKELSFRLDKEGDLSKFLYDIPAEMNEVLLLEEDAIKKFSKHIEDQKVKIENVLNQLVVNFTILCYEKKKTAYEVLDKQLQNFRYNHDYLRRKLLVFYPRDLSQSQVINNHGLIKQIQKASKYMDDDSLMAQINQEMTEIKTFKMNDPTANFESLRQLAEEVQSQEQQLPYFECSLMNSQDALESYLVKANAELFNDFFKLHHENKPLSLRALSVFDTVHNLSTQATSFLLTLMSIAQPSPKFHLLYRGSRDGFKTNTFHQLCDNRGATLVLVETHTGKIFGGYAGKSWSSEDVYEQSSRSFLFNLPEQVYHPLRAGQQQKALYCSKHLGPTFGDGFDFSVNDNDDGSLKCTIKLGVSYDCSKLEAEEVYTVKEIEVFSVKSDEVEEKEPIRAIGLYQPELLTSEEYALLRQWISPKKEINLRLIYKATQHGFDSRDFHSLCDGEKNVVVIIRSAAPHDRVFGGYTSQSWDTTTRFEYDNNAFLFSMTERQKFPVTRPERAIFKSKENGPIFGEGYDLFICSKSDVQKRSYSKLGASYNTYSAKYPEKILAGDQYFLVAEIEVLAVESQNIFKS